MGPFHRPPVSPRVAGKAVASLALGIASVSCLGIVAGLPAIVLGAQARKDIDRSGGELEGRGVAAGGIVSGLFGTGLGFVVLLWLMGAVFAPSPEVNAKIPTQTPVVSAERPPDDTMPPPVAAGTRSYGSLEVVDLDRSRPLRPQLAEIVGRARGRTVVLQTSMRASAACVAVAAALPDTRMQRALANVTLVRVEVDDYETDLDAMRVETRSAPWFYKLDNHGDPTSDAISADAWEGNVPENMAPALGRFVAAAGARPGKTPRTRRP